MIRLFCAITAIGFATLLASGCHRDTALRPLPGTTHFVYTITDIGVGLPSGLNNEGQVVGEFPAGVFPNTNGFPYFHGFLWNNGKRTEMRTFGGWYSKASEIRDSGQILGTASVREHAAGNLPVNHQCLWQSGRLIDLEADPRFRGTRALHITKFSAIYAASPPQGSGFNRDLWFYPTGLRPGPRIDQGKIGGPLIQVLAVNDKGTVIGTWNTGRKHNNFPVQQAFVWHIGDKHWTGLGTLGGPRSEPTALSNLDQVVGQADLPDDPATHRWRKHAFLWEHGRMHDLGVLPSGNYSRPSAINDSGQIVGFSNAANRQLDIRPVLWQQGQLEDLTRCVPAGTHWTSLDGAASINDYGQIVGDGGIEGDHRMHGYLLTPTGTAPR